MSQSTILQLWVVCGIIFIIIMWFGFKMLRDVELDELELIIMEKTDKEILLELLKRANLEWDEWNDYMLTWDDGYVEATFDKNGKLRDIRSRSEQ